MASRILTLLMLAGCCGMAAAGTFQDPTRPMEPAQFFGGSDAVDMDQLVLQSILYAPQRRVAVINGTRLREGDRLGNARVVRIEAARVLLETSGGMRTLHLLPRTLKR
ncbi:MAG: hypothetical protein RQ736_05620 [Thiogranum sp.]|nr:hypothetical protein [Thiogranum sp.]